jgi:hypothetical protein
MAPEAGAKWKDETACEENKSHSLLEPLTLLVFYSQDTSHQFQAILKRGELRTLRGRYHWVGRGCRFRGELSYIAK